MCGRYTLFATGELRERYKLQKKELDAIHEGLKERYNIAPSQLVPTVYEKDGKRHMELMKWGFMPIWSKDPKSIFKYKTFNARSEDIFDKPLWKRAIRQTRCLVPSTGFYEWKDTGSGKQPFFIRPKKQDLFSFAGLYSTWKDVEGLEWDTYAIITTSPNKEMEAVHNRMPVILHPKDEERWVEPSNDTPESIADLMRPYDDGKLEIYEVSRDVNTSRVDNDTLVRPVNSQ